jgi:hypothetical protein
MLLLAASFNDDDEPFCRDYIADYLMVVACLKVEI